MKMFEKNLLALGFAAAIASASAGAASVSLTDPGALAAGDTFVVDIVVDGLDTEDLAGFSIDLLFDESLLAFNSYSLGVELTDTFYGQEDLSLGEYGVGLVNVGEISWLLDFSAQPDSFVIASLEFEAIAPGSTSLSFDYLDASDPDALALALNGTDLDLDITAVPLPGALLLFGSAIAGFTGLFRRRPA